MKARFNIAFLALIFLQSLAFGASAQVRIVRMGVANSFKDMGICVQTVEEGSSGFNNYSLLVNLGKVITGMLPRPEPNCIGATRRLYTASTGENTGCHSISEEEPWQGL